MFFKGFYVHFIEIVQLKGDGKGRIRFESVGAWIRTNANAGSLGHVPTAGPHSLFK